MDIFKMDFVLSLDDRMEIISHLRELNKAHPYCSLCSSSVDIGFMRKPHGADNKQAMCLPCFLQNHSDASQELIDKIVEIGNIKGWYHD